MPSTTSSCDTGDGVNLDSIEEILLTMEKNNISADNIAFGCGGALLQKLNRDSAKFAFKASAVYENGKWREIKKISYYRSIKIFSIRSGRSFLQRWSL